MSTINERVYGLEQRTRRLEVRLAELEGRRPAAHEPPPPAEPTLRPAGSFAPPSAPCFDLLPRSQPPRRDDAPSIEDVLGGRVLAWAGGLSLLAGLVFLLVIAVSRGWIGEEARVLMAAATSLALLVVGVRASERRGRTDSALAATATGIAGMFATLVVAVQGYELIPAAVGLAIAAAVAATATTLAVRWEAPGIAALGILGAIASPLLVGAELGAATTAFVFAATASAVGVLVWQRWIWLAFTSFILATPQWVAWLLFEQPGAVPTLVMLIAFGALGGAAAVGFELRMRSDDFEHSSHLLLALNALVLAWVGWSALSETAGDAAGHAWLAGLGVAHLAFAVAGRRIAHVSHALTLASATLGVVLADVAFAATVDGLPLAAGWAVSGVAMAGLARAARQRIDADLALGGVGVHLGLALGHTLVYDAPLDAVGGGADIAGGAAVALVAASCLVSSRLAGAGPEQTARLALDALALVLVGYLSAVTLDGLALTLALAAESATLAGLACRRHDPLARAGALGFLGCAALHALVVVAPANALLDGLADPLGALALLAVAGSALAAARISGIDRFALQAMAAVVGLYLASTELVTLLGHGQQGQAALSAMWSLVGVALLLAGLLRDHHELRVGALALLTLTLTKVFLYDLASLDSMYRVASFVALGAVLLLGAFAWQRLRPDYGKRLRSPSA